MRGGRAAAVTAIVMALIASACALEGSPALTIVAKDFAFSSVPPVITGGPTTVTFRNEGQAMHELAFLRVSGDTSLDTFKKEFPAVFEGGPFPSWFADAAAVTEAPPGKSDTRTFTLTPGRWLLMCALQDQPGPQDDEIGGGDAPFHFNLGMTKWVDVEGESDELEAAADGEVVAKDYTFDVPQLKAGLNKVNFRNAGPKQVHFGAVVKYPAGFTAQQAMDNFKQSLTIQEGQPPPPGVVEPEDTGFSGVFSPGLGTTWELNLESGRTYLLACFIQDRTGGPPHAIKYGMYKAFTVQ